VVGGSNPLIPTKYHAFLPRIFVWGLIFRASLAGVRGLMSVPLLLVTNDDGVNAPGIRALAASLSSVGEVWVVAPDHEVSACAQSLTLTRSVEAREVEANVFSVDGTPADCVNLAIGRLMGRRPSIVVSGINRGANLGEDVFYSGTVGGAREAAFCGIPSVAVSLVTRGDGDFGHAARVAARLVRMVLEKGLPERTLLNVNVPLGEPARAVVTAQGRRMPGLQLLEGLGLSGIAKGWLDLARRARAATAMTDIEAVNQGLVSVTPLQTDTTHHDALSTLSAWDLALGNGHGG
jgi:5'-nucleotidase